MRIVTENMLLNDIVKMIEGNEHLELDRYMNRKILKDSMKICGYKFCTGHYKTEYLRSQRAVEMLEKFYSKNDKLKKQFSESLYYYKPNGVVWFISVGESRSEKMKTLIREMKKQEKYNYTL